MMVVVIPKNKMPEIQYTPVMYKDEIVMTGIAPNGVVMLFTALDELLFCPWDEVVEYSATAKLEKPAEPEDKKLREVTPSEEKH